ncbi:MAG: hypothetical protein ACXWQO_13085, partial [Bdellovibrionota bacterium]
MKFFAIAFMFASISAAAHGPGDVITLAQDYEGSGTCKYQKGGTLTVEKVDVDRYSSSFRVKYRSPSIFAGGCWSEATNMSWEQIHNYYLDANPIAKGEAIERARIEKEAQEKKRAERDARKIEVGVGDRITVANEATVDNFGRTQGIMVDWPDGGPNCTFQTADLFITKVSAAGVEAVVTNNPHDSFGRGCNKDAAIKLTKEQLNRWYERTILARNLKLGGKCYEQKNGKSVEQCEEQFTVNGPRFENLRKNCPEWNKVYGWENIANAPADKIAADYPGISAAAYRAGVNLNDVSYCPGGVPDAAKVRESCLKQMQVKCAGTGSANSPEESERIENIIHPEKQDNFIRGIIKNQE